MENTTTIVDAVGKDTLIILLVLFAGVLYWAFKPRWDKRHRDKNDTDINIPPGL
ncbi:MAG: cbb3-type cytochrome c oxidase subunit 3 [Rhodospirillaceae bacterium]|nr:cbb3-type cytochrome c oxidase subunit 3 [Rhodospirillaceae bacterium]MCK5545868.1 cbb3-type cytochrome c oxidase subunit 3 [Rhodospirillaceae bacterium]